MLHLHIGLAKTGTTAIQNHLKAAQSNLLRDGICYPSTGIPPNKPSHVDIVFACADHPTIEMEPLRDAFEAETKDADRVIVSSEGLQNITDTRRLASFFRQDRHVEILCCVREYLDSLRSNYAQGVQSSSYAATFEQYCQGFSHFEMAKFFDRWERFGDKLTVINYDQAAQSVDGIVPVFFDALGIGSYYKKADGNANPTISGNLLAFKLRLNSLVSHQPQFYNGLFRLALQDPRYRGPFCIHSDQAARLRAADNGYNKTVAKWCGDLIVRDFSQEHSFQPEHWASDVERFLSDRAFEAVRDIKELRDLP